ncbi:hypothetical protein [Acinetobacter gerneri]|jgi:hypothetical protein|uniref:hypothetical protein n=1 Tax=Acinetobacter gerneri TaxID=202952 RepID=UPI0023F1B7CB|nr:hypothetical protein [Acinetobacter gerneri]MCH4243846.1 hypothetical protein [Acinetobacter gerneri]
MKSLIAISLMFVSISAFAHENPDRKGQCLIVSGKNSPQPCVISSGGGAGGMYTILNINKKQYHIEESTMCEDDCGISLGSDLNHMKDASHYYLDAKTKKIVKEPKPNSPFWNCYKQVRGNLNVCYALR